MRLEIKIKGKKQISKYPFKKALLYMLKFFKFGMNK